MSYKSKYNATGSISGTNDDEYDFGGGVEDEFNYSSYDKNTFSVNNASTSYNGDKSNGAATYTSENKASVEDDNENHNQSNNTKEEEGTEKEQA